MTVAFYAFCAFAFNVEFAETVISGRAPPSLPQGPDISEPLVYWLYLGVLSYLTLTVNITIFRFFQRGRRKSACSEKSARPYPHR
jgi:hypothetical protein